MIRSFAILFLAVAACGGCRACSDCTDYSAPLARSSYGSPLQPTYDAAAVPDAASNDWDDAAAQLPADVPSVQANDPSVVSVAEYLDP